VLRFAYRWLLRLHPPRFRRRFADEMLWIFDQSDGTAAAVKLFHDGFLSLVRQWTLRSEYWEEEDTANRVLTSDGVPLFHSLEPFKPRRVALLQGGMFSIVAFYVLVLAMKYSWDHPVFLTFSGIKSNTAPEAAPSNSWDRPGADAGRGSGRSEISQSVTFDAISPAAAKSAVVEARAEESRAGASTSRLPGSDSKKPTASIVSPPSVSPLAQSLAPLVIPNEVLRSYAGTYVAGPLNEFEISITLEDGRLAIEIPGETQKPLVAVSATRFDIADSTNDWIDFKNGTYPAGSRASISLNGRHFVVHRKYF
jgi:hypothetical protein